MRRGKRERKESKLLVVEKSGQENGRQDQESINADSKHAKANNIISRAIRSDESALPSLLALYGVSPWPGQLTGWTLIHYAILQAASHSAIESLQWLLEEHGKSPWPGKRTGWTFIHYAIFQAFVGNEIESLQWLLGEYGATPWPGQPGSTLIHWVASLGKIDPKDLSQLIQGAGLSLVKQRKYAAVNQLYNMLLEEGSTLKQAIKNGLAYDFAAFIYRGNIPIDCLDDQAILGLDSYDDEKEEISSSSQKSEKEVLLERIVAAYPLIYKNPNNSAKDLLQRFNQDLGVTTQQDGNIDLPRKIADLFAKYYRVGNRCSRLSKELLIKIFQSQSTRGDFLQDMEQQHGTESKSAHSSSQEANHFGDNNRAVVVRKRTPQPSSFSICVSPPALGDEKIASQGGSNLSFQLSVLFYFPLENASLI